MQFPKEKIERETLTKVSFAVFHKIDGPQKNKELSGKK